MIAKFGWNIPVNHQLIATISHELLEVDGEGVARILTTVVSKGSIEYATTTFEVSPIDVPIPFALTEKAWAEGVEEGKEASLDFDGEDMMPVEDAT